MPMSFLIIITFVSHDSLLGQCVFWKVRDTLAVFSLPSFTFLTVSYRSHRTHVAFCWRQIFLIMFISLSGTPAFDRISKSKSCLTLSNALV